MTGDLRNIILMAFTFALMCAIAGWDWLLISLKVIKGWVTIWPAPSEHFAAVLGDAAWPLALLLIVWWLRRPIRLAMSNLSDRFERDDLDLGGWLKVTSKPISTYSPEAVAQQPGAPEKADVNIAEAILELASNDEAANRIVMWIRENVGPVTDIEAFFYDPRFAEARQNAYKALIEG